VYLELKLLVSVARFGLWETCPLRQATLQPSFPHSFVALLGTVMSLLVKALLPFLPCLNLHSSCQARSSETPGSHAVKSRKTSATPGLRLS
jgi:hypothetical protein